MAFVANLSNIFVQRSIYSDYKDFLFPVALNMLGNASDAEDLVQETMLKWLSMEKGSIENEKGRSIIVNIRVNIDNPTLFSFIFFIHDKLYCEIPKHLS